MPEHELNEANCCKWCGLPLNSIIYRYSCPVQDRQQEIKMPEYTAVKCGETSEWAVEMSGFKIAYFYENYFGRTESEQRAKEYAEWMNAKAKNSFVQIATPAARKLFDLCKKHGVVHAPKNYWEAPDQGT